MPTERLYVVVRIEGELVVLVDDDSGDWVNVESWELPPVDEGTMLRVRINDNRPQWDTAAIDPEEAARRKKKSAQAIEDLKRRDPGGDISL